MEPTESAAPDSRLRPRRRTRRETARRPGGDGPAGSESGHGENERGGVVNWRNWWRGGALGAGRTDGPEVAGREGPVRHGAADRPADDGSSAEAHAV
ncbi:hypothetical protein ABZY90_33165, partial [Streptomyces sp. NPDC006422]